jgi:hypothetical protein
LVREYAYRFGYDYDLVWWVSAVDLQVAKEDLGRLAELLGVDTVSDVVHAVLTELAVTSYRWLLIFDDVRDVIVLEEILPRNGQGQVLVTADTLPFPVPADTAFELGPFDEIDARSLLALQVDCLLSDDATRVLATVGSLPAVVDLAACWVDATAVALQHAGHVASRIEATAWAVTELERQHTRRAEVIDVADPAHRHGLVLVEVALQSLSATWQGRLIILLTHFLSMLNPAGVDVSLLCSAPLLDQFAGAAGEDGALLLGDTAAIHQLLGLGVRYGLFDVGLPNRIRLQVPRYEGAMFGRVLPGRSPEEMGGHLLRALADATPTDAEGDDLVHHPRYRELGRHLLCSGAVESPDPRVRRWVVNQIRYWYRTGDVSTLRMVCNLAERAFADWTERFGVEDQMRLRLGTQLANLHRALGDDRAALAVDDSVLMMQRRVLGMDSPRTLMTSRGRASDLLGLGRFEEALIEEYATWQGFREVYGEEHRETVMTAHDLSLCLALAGQTREALEIGIVTIERAQRLFGVTNPMIVRCAVQVAHAFRETGQLSRAHRQLELAQKWLRQARQVGQREELLLRNNLEILKRDMGGFLGAIGDHRRVIQGYRESLGTDHPESLAAWLSLAGHFFRVVNHSRAVEEAVRCMERFAAVYGPEHPFTAVCRSSQGLFLRSAHPEAALAAGRVAVRDLADRLTSTHPWALFARLTLAGHLAATGDDDGATTMETEALARGRELLSVQHPVVLIAERNLARSRVRGGAGPGDREDFLIEIPQT